MFIKHVPYEDESRAELYQAQTGRFDYGVAILDRTDPSPEELREITHWNHSSVQMRIHPDAGHTSPENGVRTWYVRWVVQAAGAEGVLLITSGQIFILNDNGKTIDRVG